MAYHRNAGRTLPPESAGPSESPRRRRQARRFRSALPPMLLLALATLQAAWLSAGVDRWTTSGPGQAEVTQIIADPFRPGRAVLILGDSLNPRLAQMTTDTGATWSDIGWPVAEGFTVTSLVFEEQDQGSLLAILMPIDVPVVPVLPEYIPPRLYRSQDGGATWTWSATELRALAASRSTPGLIYAADSHRLYASTDGGQSWDARGPNTAWPGWGSSSWHPWPYYLAVSGDQPETIWLAGELGLVKSTDGGWTWDSAGLADRQLSLLQVVGDTDNAILAGDATRLWRSTDGGDSWSPAGLTEVRRLALHPTQRSIVYAADKNWLYRSANGGLSWLIVWMGDSTDFINDVAISPGTPEMVYFASREHGLLAGGWSRAWEPAPVGGYALTSCLAVDPDDAFIVHAATATQLHTSLDGGDHWVPVADTTGHTITSLAAGSGSSGAMYAILNQEGLFKRSSEGSWRNLLMASAGSLREVRIAPNAPDVVYVARYGNDGGVYRSTNAGTNWKFLNQGPPSSGVSALAIDPYDSARLLAATNYGVFRSVNSGDSWAPPSDLWLMPIGAVAFHPRLADVAFASVAGRVFRSVDGGLTWSVLVDLGERVTHILFSADHDETLYVATSPYQTGYYAGSYSLFQVNAASGVWVRFEAPRTPIYDFAVSSVGPTTLHVATVWGVYSLTLVSEETSDFSITQPPSKKYVPGELVTFTLRVTNHGPFDFVGPVTVKDLLSSSVTLVSIDCPGWKRPQIDGALSFVYDDRFRAGMTSEITITARAPTYKSSVLTNVATVTPSRPVDPASWNNTAVSEWVRGDRRTTQAPRRQR
jgi:uncharacterized repeat protein (TIGR01451 family)